jgi:hypothetical protein
LEKIFRGNEIELYFSIELYGTLELFDAFVASKTFGQYRRSSPATPAKHAQMTPVIISNSDKIASRE